MSRGSEPLLLSRWCKGWYYPPNGCSGHERVKALIAFGGNKKGR